MEESIISLIISVIALVVAIVSFFLSKRKKENIPRESYNAVPLQLQAYERLVLLTERIALPNLISRLNQPQISAKEMQVLLLENVRQEFDYNTSQQIYVSNIAWDAIRNLKDQNMMIINQIATILPPDAKATDLNKQLLEVILAQQEKALHTIVLEAVNHEAKKLIS